MRTEGIAQSFHLRKGLLSCFFSENRQEKNSDSSKHTALKYKKEEGVCLRPRAEVRVSTGGDTSGHGRERPGVKPSDASPGLAC